MDDTSNLADLVIAEQKRLLEAFDALRDSDELSRRMKEAARDAGNDPVTSGLVAISAAVMPMIIECVQSIVNTQELLAAALRSGALSAEQSLPQ